MNSYPQLSDIQKKYDIVIGIEVHCQLASESKIFSTSHNSYGDKPNLNIDPTCVGLPGALPVLNEKCVDLALRLALALGSQIQPVSVFARKNYFYPDLPKGYQITQYDKPLALGGELTLANGKKVGIERIQLEEDAGKNIHVGTTSLIDYNRAGVGLIEVVGAPHLSTPEEASDYLKKLHSYVVHLEISDGDLEKGNFRADANVSLKPRGSKVLGKRCEIKNVNSFKYLEKAIAYEIERHYKLLESGKEISMETRGYDSDKNITVLQRSKELAHDYRYFPEPDLPPLFVSSERIERVKASLPELPDERAARFVKVYGLSDYDAKVISASRMNSSYFEDLVFKLKNKVDAKSVANYFMNDVLFAVKSITEQQGISIAELSELPIPLDHSAQLLELQANRTISGRIAKDVFAAMIETQKSPQQIVSEKNLTQILDDQEIDKICEQVLLQNPSMLADYLAGKEKLFGFFVGQAMKISGGKLNPAKVNESLTKLLSLKK